MNRRDFLRQTGGLAAGGAVCHCFARSSAADEPSVPLAEGQAVAHGPLRVCPENRRYFTDGTGKAVYLTGSHTWANLVDLGPTDPPPRFDFDAYLDFLDRYGHNFIRLWTWELTKWDTKANGENRVHTAFPHPFARTGPGTAADGKPKSDLTKFDPEYFRRLRTRVEAAGKRGIYVSIMLFEGWGMQFVSGAWKSHPFHSENNANGVGREVQQGVDIHTLKHPAIRAIQERYVRKVVDTVSDLDNVLYEISNENHPPSTEWQYHVIRFIHEYERGKAKQHPVGMTFQYKGGSNKTLFDSPADWISPNSDGGYRDDPPAADGRKVVLSDTDHLWGMGGDRAWAWKSFLRGLNPLFMDPYKGDVLGQKSDPRWEPVRKALGHTLRLSRRLDLAAMSPQNALASSAYCLATTANPKTAYVVYLPKGGEVSVDLSPAKGALGVQWLNPETGTMQPGVKTEGGQRRQFTAPFAGNAVLWITTS